MRLQHPLAVVTPTVDGDVLSALARASDWFTIERLRVVIGRRSPDGIRKALARLEAEGIVESMPAGRARLYRLEREHLAAGAVVALSRIFETFVDRLAEDMSQWGMLPLYAALFGSAARGEMSETSDVDLFLLRPDAVDETWEVDVSALQARASRWVGADVRILDIAGAEVEGSVEPVVTDILAEGVGVFGDRAALARLARR
jgi:DNA-binding transcriptional ArsR family regulator